MEGLENLTLEIDGGVATVTLNRPQALNALNEALGRELLAVLGWARTDTAVKVLVLTGAGRAFSAGGDLRELQAVDGPARGRDFVAALGRVILAMTALEKPIIAAVNGVAAGAGFNLALAADLILAADTARFTQAFVKVGLLPDAGGCYFLPRAVGMAKAKELIFTGETIDAAEAERIGLLNRVVPAADLMAEAMKLARRIAAGPGYAIGLAKTVLHRAAGASLGDAIDMEATAQGLLMSTADHREGVAAFIEKREPRFTGR